MSEVPNNKLKNALLWFRISAELLGWPTLLILVCVGAQRMFFTLSCNTAGYGCKYAFSAAAVSGNELLQAGAGPAAPNK